MTTARCLQPMVMLLGMCRFDCVDGVLNTTSFRNPLGRIISMLHLAVGFDNHYTNQNGQDLPTSQRVSRWTTEIPSKDYVKGLQKGASDSVYARERQLAQTTQQDLYRLQTFLAAAVLKLRRNPSLEARISVPDLTDDIFDISWDRDIFKTVWKFLDLQPVDLTVPYSQPRPWSSEHINVGKDSRFVCRMTMVSATVQQNVVMGEVLQPLACIGVTCDVATEGERAMIEAGAFDVA